MLCSITLPPLPEAAREARQLLNKIEKVEATLADTEQVIALSECKQQTKLSS